jgi:hypothetical protein
MRDWSNPVGSDPAAILRDVADLARGGPQRVLEPGWCQSFNKRGTQCRTPVVPGSAYCAAHHPGGWIGPRRRPWGSPGA